MLVFVSQRRHSGCSGLVPSGTSSAPRCQSSGTRPTPIPLPCPGPRSGEPLQVLGASPPLSPSEASPRLARSSGAGPAPTAPFPPFPPSRAQSHPTRLSPPWGLHLWQPPEGDFVPGTNVGRVRVRDGRGGGEERVPLRRFPGPGRGVGHPSMSQLKRWCFTSMSCTPSFSGFFSFSCRETESRVSAPRPEKPGGSIRGRDAGTAARQLLHCPPPRSGEGPNASPCPWHRKG